MLLFGQCFSKDMEMLQKVAKTEDFEWLLTGLFSLN